ncbi:hypothetical protein V6N13_115976 [Hibiscus sabdariffa]|uniref:Uncharacterized protein n=1 Tax=Hibiscus sabdariffa TaxID=183260 RepID=A0ABR2QSD9_9ROSI
MAGEVLASLTLLDKTFSGLALKLQQVPRHCPQFPLVPSQGPVDANCRTALPSALFSYPHKTNNNPTNDGSYKLWITAFSP